MHLLKSTIAVVTAAALAASVASYTPVGAWPLPPPPPPAAPHIPGAGPPVAFWGFFACVAGTMLGAAAIAARYNREAANAGFCGIGMRPATCADIRNGSYSVGPGEMRTPEQVKADNIRAYCKHRPHKKKHRRIVRYRW